MFELSHLYSINTLSIKFQAYFKLTLKARIKDCPKDEYTILNQEFVFDTFRHSGETAFDSSNASKSPDERQLETNSTAALAPSKKSALLKSLSKYGRIRKCVKNIFRRKWRTWGYLDKIQYKPGSETVMSNSELIYSRFFLFFSVEYLYWYWIVPKLRINDTIAKSSPN